LWRVLDRIELIRRVILSKLRITGETTRALSLDPSRDDSGYFVLRFYLDGDYIDVYELLDSGQILRYSYALIHGGKRVLGYDNAPHHPEIYTYPHHKHYENQVLPLENPSIESFIEEVSQYLA